MTGRDEIDRLLRERGEHWRAKPLPMPKVDRSMFTEPRSPRLGYGAQWLSAAAGLVVLAVLAGVALRTIPAGPAASGVGLVATPTSSAATSAAGTPSVAPSLTSAPSPVPTLATPSASPAPTPRDPQVVENGDSVVASGNLFETETASEALLCPAAGWAPDIGCIGTVVVPIRGVDVREFLGSEADPNVPDLPAGTWVTDWLRIEGVWVDGALEVGHIEPTQRPSLGGLFPVPAVPCDPPLGGWPGHGGADGDVEQALAALEAEVSGNKDVYSGVSSAVIEGAGDQMDEQATVVGTLDNVGTVAEELREIYPYNLCVIHVDYSAAELEEVAHELRATYGSWEVTDIEYGFGRLVVRVPVFDPTTSLALTPYADAIRVEPIVALASD